MLAALHYLVLEGRASWDDVGRAFDEHDDALRGYVAEQPIQTNEVQRSWMLLPCFLEVARRAAVGTFDVVDLGSSAGFNLFWDRHRYVYEQGTWGPASARLTLAGDERDPVPAAVLDTPVRVRRRTGIDLSPIDVTTESGARLMRSFVWADQEWRLELLDRAIEAVRDDPPELVQGDLLERLPEVLAARDDGALTVVAQTAVIGYLPDEGRRRAREILDEAGAAGPLAYVTATQPMKDEHQYWGLVVQLWPGGERHMVAHGDFHGRWLRWLS